MFISFSDLAKEQAKDLDYKINTAVDAIKTAFDVCKHRAAIAFSGGKDSTVLWHLIRQHYNNPGLSTIISSEKTIDELLRIDQGVGSRIFQRTKSYCVNITADVKKNYRLAGG